MKTTARDMKTGSSATTNSLPCGAKRQRERSKRNIRLYKKGPKITCFYRITLPSFSHIPGIVGQEFKTHVTVLLHLMVCIHLGLIKVLITHEPNATQTRNLHQYTTSNRFLLNLNTNSFPSTSYRSLWRLVVAKPGLPS